LINQYKPVAITSLTFPITFPFLSAITQKATDVEKDWRRGERNGEGDVEMWDVIGIIKA
jgi:hypothetical protein